MKFPMFLRKPKPYKRLRLDRILCQFNPGQALKPYFLKIHLNSITPSTPTSPNWSLSLLVVTKKMNVLLPHACNMLRQSFHSSLNHPNILSV